MTWVIKNWKLLLIGVLLLTVVILGKMLIASYKDNGELQAGARINKETIRILGERVVDANKKLTDQNAAATTGFEVCERAAATSDSASFKKGIEVGKILGRNEACTVSSPDAPWPSVSPPARPTAQSK